MNKDPLLGTVVNEKYRVDSLIGEGGMGKVFCVTHLELNKRFALKLMQFDLATNSAKNIARFKREASTLAKLNHPNIVSIIDFGIIQPSQLPYIVMEYIQGVTLRKLLRAKGTLGESQAINITKQLCLALHEAHSLGVIHRDLKPENIIIRELDENQFLVRIVDFGIAKLMKGETTSKNDESSEGNPGTLRYCAPEQFFRQPLDTRADIFSLSLIFYEMLTGEVPTVMLGHFKPLAEMRPGVTPKLSDIIEKGLAQLPKDRPENVLLLKKELDQIEQTHLLEGLKEQIKPQTIVIQPKPLDHSFKSDTLTNKTGEIKTNWTNWIFLFVILFAIGGVGSYKAYQYFYSSKEFSFSLPQLVNIKGESFFMGSDVADQYSKPSHKVTINSFKVSRELITNKQYAEFVKVGLYSAPAYWKSDLPTEDILEKPVTNITWNDANAYCKWLSKQTGQKYRLLSEAEWEYIARNNTSLGIKEIAGDYFEWTSSEFRLYEGSTLTLPEKLIQNPAVVLRGKDEKVGQDPISDRLWQERNYTDPKLGFRVAMDSEN